MHNEISQLELLLPSESGELEDLAYRLVETSAELNGGLSPATLSGIAGLLRVVNSYYSNLIEGHNTHPIDIQRAMRKNHSANAEKRDLQTESRIHIEVQQKILERLAAEPETNVASTDFLRWIHGEFYFSMPERLRWVEGENREKAWVERRNAGLVLSEKGVKYPPLPVRTTAVLKEVAIKGELDRSAIYKIFEMKERTGRNALRNLLDEGLLVSDSDWHKSRVRLGFPAQVAAYIFPKLFPDDVRAEEANLFS